ncbi:hypothetical protein FSST1_012788 [Fusarium sambucinum]
MRVSSGLLLVCASSAFGQFTRFSNTSISAIETSTSPMIKTSSNEATTTSLEATTSSIPDSVELDLRSFTLGQGCSFYPPPDGNAILFHPVQSDQTLDRRLVLPFVPPPFVAITRAQIPIPLPWPQQTYSVVNITIDCSVHVCSRKIKRETRSPCLFQVLVNGEVVSAEPILSPSQSTLSLTTNPFDSKGDFEFRQSCGDESEIIDVVLNGVTLKRSLGATSRPIPSIIIGPETGSATETNSQGATTNSGDETITPTTTVGSEFTTNSEGETVFPTGTQADDSTNSAGATTNSQGETIVPTGTQTDGSTNSADFTTNSEGETIIPTGTATGTSPSSSSTSLAGFPSDIGVFSLFGCVGSTAGFPSFELVQSSGSMDLNACATFCDGSAYFGVHDTSCYCGDDIDAANTRRVNLEQCDIECPGDDTQLCGGESRSNKLWVRQNVPSSQLLTVYVAAEAAVTVTDSATQAVTDKETTITTFTTTVTGATAITTEAVTATLVCVSGKCYSTSSSDVTVYIFVEINGSECDGQWVYISEPCSCAGGQRYVPQFCTGGSCSGLKVYKAEECHDWYNYNSFFVASDCATCAEGKVVYLPWEKSWGTPDNCNDDVPVCSGYDCPSKPNGGGSHSGYPGGNHGDKGNSNVPHEGSHGGSNGGSYEGSNGGSQGGSNGGSSPGSYGTPNGEAVNGETPNGETPNGGSEGGSSSGANSNPSGGSGSGSQGDSHSPNGSGSKGSETGGKPGTVPVVISGASKQTTIAFGLLALLAAFL